MEKLLKNLALRGFEPYFEKDTQAAITKIAQLIPKGSSIGFGGSMTVSEMGLLDALKADYTLYHREIPEGRSADEIYELSAHADWFISSTNALCETGDLVNIDGRANRISSMVFGPKNVLIVCGTNKIVADIAEGIERTRNVATPPNCIRLHKKTPCAVTGKCMHCNSPDTICKATLILHHPTTDKRVVILIVDQKLGY